MSRSANRRNKSSIPPAPPVNLTGPELAHSMFAANNPDQIKQVQQDQEKKNRTLRVESFVLNTASDIYKMLIREAALAGEFPTFKEILERKEGDENDPYMQLLRLSAVIATDAAQVLAIETGLIIPGPAPTEEDAQPDVKA